MHTALEPELLLAIDQRIEQRFDALLKMGRLTARGTVTDYRPGTLDAMVTFDGSIQSVPVKVYRSCRPLEGDRVGLLKFYGQWFIVANEAYRGPSSAAVWNSAAVFGTKSDGTYSAVPTNVVTTITKRYPDSKLWVGVQASAYTDTASTSGWWSALITGTDIDGNTVNQEFNLAFHQHNLVNVHHSFGGVHRLDMPAGELTLTLRWRRGVGGGALKTDSYDWVVFWGYEGE